MTCEGQCRFHWPTATTTLALGLCLVPLGNVVSMAEARGPAPCVLPPVFFLLPSHPRLCPLWAHRAHVYLGWASVSWTERDGRARSEALLVYVLARPEDPRPGPPTPAPGAGGGGGCPAGGAPLRPHHRPLQVGPPSHPPGQGSPPTPAAPPLTPPIPSALSAGIGRTGCFIATSICCQQLRQEGVVDILKTTCQLRQDRSAHGQGGARGEREP